MDRFRIDFGKLDVQCNDIENYEITIKEIEENLNSIRVGMRHKLRSMDGIGNNLKKIEKSLQSEAMMMTKMGGALESIIGHYRKTENSILNSEVNIVSEKTITIWQDEAASFEKNVKMMKPEKGFEKTLYIKTDTGIVDKPQEEYLYLDSDRYLFDEEAEVYSRDGFYIGDSDRYGYVKGTDGLYLGGQVDKWGIYKDENGVIKGSRADCELKIHETKNGLLVDFGGYEEEERNSKEHNGGRIRKNSDLLFFEWRNWEDNTKKDMSKSMQKIGIPKRIADRVADVAISLNSSESFAEDMHDAYVHGDIKKGLNALANKTFSAMPGYTTTKMFFTQLGILVKNTRN